MSWKNIKLILFREIRDQLRDRRTLFMIAVLPLLLYPALGIGMINMMSVMSEQTATVAILGADDLPEHPQLITDENRFVSTYFRIPDDAEKLDIVTDVEPATELEGAEAARRKQVLEQAKAIRELIEQKRELGDRDRQATSRINGRISRLMAQNRLQVLVIIPEGFAENIDRANRQFSQQVGAKTTKRARGAAYRRPEVVWNKADEKSRVAYRRVKEAMDQWDQVILTQRLAQANLPSDFSDPVGAVTVDVAEQGQISASVWSKLIPALLVIMAVTGAFYPAVDLAAGEKERGTMETLLICPASRSEIVIGKFLTVLCFSMTTALLNLLTIGLTGRYMTSMMGGGTLGKIGNLAPPPLTGILWVFVLLIPVAALFSALSLSLATFARSSKEGQYYLTPLLLVTMGLTIFCLFPTVEMTPFFSVLPVIAPTLLLKGLLSPADTTNIWYAVPVLVTSIGYSLLALWWAIDQFSRETVLFRESERFELRLWLQHMLRDKQRVPSFAEAGFLFVVIMLLQFGAMKMMQDRAVGASPDARASVMMQLLIVQQVAIIATPAVLMGLILTSSLRDTLRLRWPGWKFMAVAALLPLALHPLTLELGALLQESFFPKPPKSITSQISLMTSDDMPLGVVLLVFALAPAICEEIAFRGFILSGFSQSQRMWLAVVLSSLAFGIIHMIPQQVFNAALVGLVLGLLAIRSNSLLPCILFHFVYNSLAVLNGRVDHSKITEAPFNWFVYGYGQSTRYEWLTLTIAAVAAIALLRWLANNQSERRAVPRDPDPLGSAPAFGPEQPSAA